MQETVGTDEILHHMGIRSASPITVIVNLTGAFALGLVMGLIERSGKCSDEVRVGLTAGLLGGFTTYSAFAADVAQFANDSRWYAASLYVVAHALFGPLLFVFGMRIMSWWT